MTMTELAESTDAAEMIESMTVDSIDQRELAGQLLEQAKEQNIELVGPGGLLGQLTKSVLETALDAEMSEHLGMRSMTRRDATAATAVTGRALRSVLRETGRSRSTWRGIPSRRLS
jgi:putative transposase